MQRVIDKGSRIIVALDYAQPVQALALVQQHLTPEICRLKIGKELFTRGGPELVSQLVARGFDVFLDLKFHDIPTTVAKACTAAADLGVWMLNVHCLGGRKMLDAARAAIAKTDTNAILLGVTVLTSMDRDDLQEVGLFGEPNVHVLRLATLASSCGLDGVVCSAQETILLRLSVGSEFCLVTPGIRPLGADVTDQKRTMTPTQALQNGADYLVIGRPITGADNPMRALLTITEEIAAIEL